MKEKLLTVLDNINISYLLLVVFVANIADAFLTLSWIDMGIATEANPIMALLIDMGAEWFLIGKIGSVSAACVILYHLRSNRSAKFVALLSCALYFGIIVFHLLGASSAGVSFL